MQSVQQGSKVSTRTVQFLPTCLGNRRRCKKKKYRSKPAPTSAPSIGCLSYYSVVDEPELELIFGFTLVNNSVGNRGQYIGRQVGKQVATQIRAVFTTYLIQPACELLVGRQKKEEANGANHHDQLVNLNSTENCS